MRVHCISLVSIAAITTMMVPCAGQTPIQVPFDSLMTSDFPEEEGFATAFEIDGDLLIAGAHGFGNQVGSTYLFERTPSGWSEIVELSSLVPVNEFQFGFAVDVSGGTAAVGAPANDEMGNDHGAVYLFEETSPGNWVFDQKIVPPNPEMMVDFGTYVGIDGDHLVVFGYETESFFLYDHVFTYERQGGTWVHTQTFEPCCSIPYEDCFDMDGDTFVIGGDVNNPNGRSSGSVWVYRRTGSQWALEQEIIPHDGAEYDLFGRSVGLSGDTLAVGAPTCPFMSTERPGKAYVYVRNLQNQWVLEQLIPSPEPVFADSYGRAIDVQSDTLAVAAPFNHTSNYSNPFVYHREAGQWRQHLVLDGELEFSSGLFGTGMVIDGDEVWVGHASEDVSYGFQVSRDLTIARPSTVQAGETLSVTTCLGQPGALMLLFLVDVNGIPTFQRVTNGLFDAEGQITFSLDILAGLEGNTLDFASVFRNAENKLVLTEPARVTFE